MSRSTITFYKYPLKAHVVLGDHGIRNLNMPFGESDFKVYKGAAISIDFDIKNTDRKPINLVGKTLTITIIDHESRNEIISKDLTVIDEYKGKAQLFLSADETYEFDEGWYNYFMLYSEDGENKHVLYTDQVQSADGSLQVIGEMIPGAATSIEVPPTTKWRTVDFDGVTYLISDAIPGDIQQGSEDGLHTIAIYTKNYTGAFKIQGTLEQNPPSEHRMWFDIHLTPNKFELNYNNSTCIDAYNFTANVTWFRFITEAPKSEEDGEIEKILVKI